MFTEDLSVFFDEAEFADTATLDSAPVVGIFTRDYQLANPLGIEGMANSLPAFELPTANVGVLPVGKLLVVSSGLGVGTWKVTEHHPDGSGVSRLFLHKV